MGDANDTGSMENADLTADASQPSVGEAAGAEKGGGDAAGESRAVDVGMPSDPGSAGDGGTKAGWFNRLSGNHKMLLGIGVGILAVLLLAGMFAIGYCVGRPCDEREMRVPERQFQPQGPIQRDLPSAPSPGLGGEGLGLPGILSRHGDDIESVIAGKLGISEGDLQDEIESGKTIIEIAEEKGVSTEDLTAAVAAKIGAIADELAADGEITAARAEEIKSDVDDIASRLIEMGHLRAGMPPGR